MKHPLDLTRPESKEETQLTHTWDPNCSYERPTHGGGPRGWKPRSPWRRDGDAALVQPSWGADLALPASAQPGLRLWETRLVGAAMKGPPVRRHVRRSFAVPMATALALVVSGCAGWGGGPGSGGKDSINVLMVNNPQMVDLQRLTAEHFTKDTGINVNFTVLPKNDVRDKISQEFSSQAGQYDAATLSNFEIPIYAKSQWIAPLDDHVAADPTFDQSDILPPMTASLSADGKLYGEPFYGESSFLMYRKDVLAAKGIEMPANPTWPQVADIAAKLQGAQPGMAPICLRGQPGWGQLFAPLTTVVNTFGGTWFTADWKAQVDGEGFRKATDFYVDLVRAHGETGAPQAGFAECLNAMVQGNAAMWYDATSAAGSLDANGSPVKGKIGYVAAPV